MENFSSERFPHRAPKPFDYSVIDNFLSEDQLARAAKIYESLQFKEIHTDLYKFLQTGELSAKKRLAFLKSSLDRVFEHRIGKKNTFYNIFASFYRRGDFLLCHDDMVDQRLYAFTFYLEDFDSGKLIIYEDDCKTVHETIDVRRNRLVVFEVQKSSFHEVDLCLKDGRKTFTGWINSPYKQNKPQPLDKALSLSTSIEYFDLELDIEDGSFICFEFKDIECKEISRTICGPFTDRRCTKIVLDVDFVPFFPGYKLIHNEYLLIGEGSYILCNDKINSTTEDILDAFIFKCEEDVPGFLNYVDQSSNVSFTIDALDGHMIVGERDNHNICIHRARKPVYLKHYMYKKLDGTGQGTSKDHRWQEKPKKMEII